MLKQVTLSSGETAHFKAWKRKAEKAYKAALNVRYRRDMESGEMEVMQEIHDIDLDRAREAALPIVIDRIERAGEQIAYTPEWADNLSVADYALLEAAVLELRLKARQSGEKKTEPTS